MNHTKYDKLAQMPAHKPEYKSDWPLIICYLIFCVFGFLLLNSIADWAVGIN